MRSKRSSSRSDAGAPGGSGRPGNASASKPAAAPRREGQRLWIGGVHPVRESLIRRPGDLEAIWIAEGARPARMEALLALAEQAGIPVVLRPAAELKARFPSPAHQGVVAVSAPFAYTGSDDLLAQAQAAGNAALLVAGDHITDEGNLGAVLRSMAFFGAHGLILPRDRSARVTSTVLKRSAGAALHVPVARVVNLGRCLEQFAAKGLWIIGASGEGRVSCWTFDWNRPVVLVLGSEGRGLGRTVRRRCHSVVRIPGSGGMESLNVAVAAGVLLAEIGRRRQASSND